MCYTTASLLVFVQYSSSSMLSEQARPQENSELINGKQKEKVELPHNLFTNLATFEQVDINCIC